MVHWRRHGHEVALCDGKVCWYRNRWVRSPASVPTSTSSCPAGSTRGQAVSWASVPPVNVLTPGGKTLELVDGGVANYELTADLDTIGTCDFDDTLTGWLHRASATFAP
nr:carotenoid oxygenase family protein [Mycobacterium uberis]